MDKKVEVVDRLIGLSLYNEYIADQQETFIKIMEFTNRIINRLIENGKISEYTILRARIKGAESALKNDKFKALDDVFGMEIIVASDEELEIIMDILEKCMDIIKIHSIDKSESSGYKAMHKMMILKREQLGKTGIKEEDYVRVPMIEFQLKTFQTLSNMAKQNDEHELYKNLELQRKHDEAPKDMKTIRREIQEKYDRGDFDVDNGSNLYLVPTMWENKSGKMTRLTYKEVLKKLYPFLNLNNKEYSIDDKEK